MYRVNNLKNAVTDTVFGWYFDLTYGPWNVPNSVTVGSCDGPWFGWKDWALIGSISTSLYGQGNASLTFGNCWETGVVKLFANESEISSVGPHSQKTVVFEFDNTNIKLEEHGTGIIHFFHFEIPQCIIGKKKAENYGIISESESSIKKILKDNGKINNLDSKFINRLSSSKAYSPKENIEIESNMWTIHYRNSILKKRRRISHPGNIQHLKSSTELNGPTELKKTHHANAKFGLKVVLNPKVPEYGYALKNSFIGFKTLVHTPYDFAEVDAIGMAIDQNSESYIGIRGYHAWTTDAANGLDMKHKRCLARTDDLTKYHDIRMDIFANYTKKGCILECHANLYYDMCRCLPYHYPDFTNAWHVNSTACDYNGLRCLSTVKGK